jgi:hypothetical protein
MTRKILLFAAMIIALSSCKSKKTAYNYNQEIVAMEKELEPAITTTENNVARYAAANQFDSIAIAGKAMEEKVQKKIDIIEAKAAPSAKEGDNFKAAVLKYFKFIRGLYSDYVKLGNAKDQAGRDEVLVNIQKVVDEKQKVINDMQTAQKKYAEANGFKVQ